jgi:hypothetical protein
MMLDWPERNEKTGKPVTTALNQSILKAAALAAADELPDAVATFEELLANCTNWRRDYIPIMEALVHIQAEASPATVVRMCQDGLDCAANSFVMRSSSTTTAEDSVVSIPEAFQQPFEPLQTMTYTGTKTTAVNDTNNEFQLASPHGTDTNPVWVTGNDAIAQIEAWKTYGCMEASAAEHAAAVCRADNTNTIVDYVANKTFVLLGITSEMGPARHLLKIPGAHVMGVARAGAKLDQLTEWFVQNGPTTTTLQVASANLLEQVPAIAHWIVQNTTTTPLTEDRRQLVLLPLAYMDGEANVRVTVAMDAILTYVLSHQRTDHALALAYLTSPTTIYTIPNEAAADAKRRYEQEQQNSWTYKLVSAVSLGSWLKPSNTWKQLEDNNGSRPVVYNGAYRLQGPNYCLAKMMQQWRCVAEHAAGTLVCAPHAPGTRTWSVMHNKEAAVAVEGLQYFPPMLTFDVLPCSSLLTAILLHQLHATEKKEYGHPFELFWDGAVHGGGWRCPYSSDSILALTYLLGKTMAKSGWCPQAALAPKPSVANY